MSQKLKGIYDALDLGNHKNAVKLCGALLKKEPNHALCKALNAVALERTGRREEALKMCEEAQVGAGVDDTVLNTVQVVYKRCRQNAKTMQMYDAAWAKDPDNKEYGAALFSAAIRCSDFSKSQQVATKLFRKLNVPKYLHWVVVSILLQAKAKKDLKPLDLAEMMLQKAPVEPAKSGEFMKLDRGQQYLLLLHLTTLRSKGKCKEALELLESCKGHMTFPTDVAKLRVQLLEEAGCISDATKAARELVLLDITSWAAVQDYIRLAFQCPLPDGASLPSNHGTRLRGPFGKEADGTVVASLEDVERLHSGDEVWNAAMFFQHLNKETPTGHKCRVPQLARLELYRAAFRANEADSSASHASSCWRSVVSEGDWDVFVDLITSYLRDHGGKNYCFYDLKAFLCLLDESDAPPLFKVLEATCAGGDQKAALGAELGLSRLRRGFARPVAREGDQLEQAMEACAAEVTRLLGKWKELSTRPQGEEDGPKVLPEEHLILAVMSLVDLDRMHCYKLQRPPSLSERSYLLDALALAELGLAALPDCYQFKVVLMLICAALGLPSAMLRWYSTLDLKNIQYESLMYLAFDAVSSVGCHEASRELGRTIMAFHDDYDKDTSQALESAFHSGVYHRILEYYESQELMGRSILWGRAVVEDTLASMGQAQTLEALTESVVRQDGLLEAVASKPAEWWIFRNQDRSMLQGWQPLPRCSPLSADASHVSGNSWKAGGPVPTSLAGSGRCRSGISAAAVWEPAVDAPAPLLPSKDPTGTCGGGRSAVEELLTLGLERSPSRLRSTASVLVAVQGLLQRDEKMMVQAMQAAKEALTNDGVAAQDLADALVSTESVAAPCDSKLGLPWCTVPPAFKALVQQGAAAAGEVGLLALQASGTGQAWEDVQRGLEALATMTRKCVDAIRGSESSAEVKATLGSFSFSMSHGVPMLWLFLNEFAMVLIPVLLWCSTLPKAKKGQEAMTAARAAIKSLFSTLQTGLVELQGDLAFAEGARGPHETKLKSAGVETPVKGLLDLPEFEKFREQVPLTLLDAHQKHLATMRDSVTMRLALLKTKSSFKP